MAEHAAFPQERRRRDPSVVIPGPGRKAPDQLRAAMPVRLENRHFGRADLKADDLAQRILAADQDGVGARKRRNAELMTDVIGIEHADIGLNAAEREHRRIPRAALRMRQDDSHPDPGAPDVLAQQRSLAYAVRSEVALVRAVGEGLRRAVRIEVVRRPLVALRMAQIHDISALLQPADQALFPRLLVQGDRGVGDTGQQADGHKAGKQALQNHALATTGDATLGSRDDEALTRAAYCALCRKAMVSSTW